MEARMTLSINPIEPKILPHRRMGEDFCSGHRHD